MNTSLSVAVLVPCYNEEHTVERVVTAFRAQLPQATIYVYDNNSTDNTALRAREAGAIVRNETQQGKGSVVRRMFADIEADIYVLVDGDDTYDASSASQMVQMLQHDVLDMVVAVRKDQTEGAAYRAGHVFGNRMFNVVFSLAFGNPFSDIFSGFRVFSRRFVKSFPVLSTGFEIETEMSVHALELMMPCAEVESPYFSRPEGSISKLSTYKDGLRILFAMLYLTKETMPFKFYGLLAGACAVLSLILGVPVIGEFMDTGLVERFPTAILASSIAVISGTVFVTGLITQSISKARLEAKRLSYLSCRHLHTSSSEQPNHDA